MLSSRQQERKLWCRTQANLADLVQRRARGRRRAPAAAAAAGRQRALPFMPSVPRQPGPVLFRCLTPVGKTECTNSSLVCMHFRQCTPFVPLPGPPCLPAGGATAGAAGGSGAATPPPREQQRSAKEGAHEFVGVQIHPGRRCIGFTPPLPPASQPSQPACCQVPMSVSTPGPPLCLFLTCHLPPCTLHGNCGS